MKISAAVAAPEDPPRRNSSLPQHPPLEPYELLDNALRNGDAAQLAEALGLLVRAEGMSKVAEAAGISRMSLYKIVENKSGMRLSTLFQVLKALGYRLSIEPLPAE